MENLTTGMTNGYADNKEESPSPISFGPNQTLKSTAFRESPRTPMATQELRDELIETTRVHYFY
jgi:hypothetical protein